MSWTSETNIKGPPGGLGEAPQDGQTYGRNNAAWMTVQSGGGGSAGTGEWTFNSTITPPPGSGQVRLNNATQASATHVYVSDVTAPGSNVGTLFRYQMKSGSKIYIQDKNNAGTWILFQTTADAVDGGGYSDVAVTYVNGAGTIPAQRVIVTLSPVSTGGGGGAASGITVTPAGNIASTDVQAALQELDTEKVARAGDTMTGNLTVNKSNPSLVLQKTAAGQASQLAGYNGVNARWSMALGDNAAEGGSNAGSNFALYRYTDAGALIDTPLTVARATGGVTLTGALVLAADPGVALGAATKQYVDGSVRAPATATPLVESGAGTVGTSLKYAREDHVHPLGPGGGSGFPAPQGRLTLAAATPVMVTTQAAKTTLYYTPYTGDTVPIYDGTNMVPTTFPEIAVLTTDTTKNPAAIGANKVNDWFVWNDAGTIRLSHGPDWTSDTARSAGTVLTRTRGILVNSVAITNGPGVVRGTYVGTTRSNAAASLDWIYSVPATPLTVPGFFGVWNMYNRVDVTTFVQDTAVSWTYGVLGYRAPNGNTNTFRVSFVSGLAEDAFTANYSITGTNSATGYCVIGVGYDSTSAFAGAASSSNQILSAIMYCGKPEYSRVDTGFHFVSALENTSGGTVTFYGNNSVLQSALNFRFRM